MPGQPGTSDYSHRSLQTGRFLGKRSAASYRLPAKKIAGTAFPGMGGAPLTVVPFSTTRPKIVMAVWKAHELSGRKSIEDSVHQQPVQDSPSQLAAVCIDTPQRTQPLRPHRMHLESIPPDRRAIHGPHAWAGRRSSYMCSRQPMPVVDEQSAVGLAACVGNEIDSLACPCVSPRAADGERAGDGRSTSRCHFRLRSAPLGEHGHGFGLSESMILLIARTALRVLGVRAALASRDGGATCMDAWLKDACRARGSGLGTTGPAVAPAIRRRSHEISRRSPSSGNLYWGGEGRQRCGSPCTAQQDEKHNNPLWR